MSALALPGLSPEQRCVDNRGISSRYQSRISTVIHITEYDLTNCTRSEPFVASLCGGLWSVFTTASGRGPLLVTAQKLPQRRRAPRDPRPMLSASDLWGSVLAGFQGPSLGTRLALARPTSGQKGTEAPSNRPTAHSLTPATPCSRTPRRHSPPASGGRPHLDNA